MHNLLQDIIAAERTIRPFLAPTPLILSEPYSSQTGMQLYLKCDNFQPVGSFKIRGALNALHNLSSKQRQTGIVTASSGNHGAALSYGLSLQKVRGTVFVPERTPDIKTEKIRRYIKDIRFHGHDSGETEQHAFAYAQQYQMTYLSPYNNYHVIAGQGSMGVEIFNQLKDIAAIFIPTSGGGLAAGIAAYIKHVSPNTKIIACFPENSPVLAHWLWHGKPTPVTISDTLSDATFGDVDPKTITFPLCQKYIDETVTVSEKEIEAAILATLANHQFVIEGAAAVALASALKSASKYHGKNCVVILSGGNIDLKVLKSIL